MQGCMEPGGFYQPLYQQGHTLKSPLKRSFMFLCFYCPGPQRNQRKAQGPNAHCLKGKAYVNLYSFITVVLNEKIKGDMLLFSLNVLLLIN